ncbi:MAG: methyltransferase domain-containing protein [Chloroflexota bacterium]
MINSPGTDRDILIHKAYANDELLAVRQRTHELYSIPKVNFTEWVLDRVAWQGNETVLDIGAGPGTYFSLVKARIPHGVLIGGDLSLGMAYRALQHPDVDLVLNADAQILPFADNTFDVVLANHMLYHLPNLDAALADIQRILKPTGRLIAATNSQYNLPEFDQLFRRAYGLLGAVGPDVEPMRSTAHNFHLEDGAMKLSHHFFAVARYDLPGAFVFPSVQPALDYINSTRALREPQLPRRIAWDDFMSVMSDQIQRLINHFGELMVNKLSGVLIATDRGDFAQDYVERLGRD